MKRKVFRQIALLFTIIICAGVLSSCGGKKHEPAPDNLVLTVKKEEAVSKSASSEANKAFLQENMKKEGVKVTSSGLQYKVLKEGKGKSPLATDSVTVNYEGKFINGKTFDSSYDRKKPITFALNGVIRGWTEGLQLMKEGAVYEFCIPSNLAYGDQGNQNIPGGSTLIFKVELIKVKTVHKT